MLNLRRLEGLTNLAERQRNDVIGQRVSIDARVHGYDTTALPELISGHRRIIFRQVVSENITVVINMTSNEQVPRLAGTHVPA